MWSVCFWISLCCLVASVVTPYLFNAGILGKTRPVRLINMLMAGVLLASVFLFFPVHRTQSDAWRAFLLSLFNAMQVFALGCEFAIVAEGVAACPQWLAGGDQFYFAVLFVVAPFLTFGFVLSLFKNVSAHLRYLFAYFQDAYIFSELNERSLALAEDIRKEKPGAVIVFTDVFDDREEVSYELSQEAKRLRAICFKKDVLVVDFAKHAARKALNFFAIGQDETENLNHALKLIERYRNGANRNLYVFSTKLESELLLTSVDKGQIKVRRINQVQSLVNRILYEQGHILFDSAKETADGSKCITAVVVGLGNHGTEMVKALAWYGQMDGYRLEIHAFDRDPLAEEKFTSLAPELMSPVYNGVSVPGEAQYHIHIHSGVDVNTISFANAIAQIPDATYVIVALGNDDVNINTAVHLRMYFERMKIHPVIQSIVYNSQQKQALEGITNYRGQAYDITFIGDIASSYTERVIIDSELEEDALRRHMKWGKEAEFWTYEYNYRSSMASAIHMRARIHCHIPGADKKEEDLTLQERDGIEVLEHRRWNAYMRAEGYVFSGSKDKSSRNDLAKMHHDLVDFSSLSDEEKRKDSRVGSQ